MLSADTLATLTWNKSSRSGSNANCVEVAEVPAQVWRKSSRSGSNSNCVEVAELPAAMAVRDSKDREGAVLLFSADLWTAFIEGVRQDSFDRWS